MVYSHDFFLKPQFNSSESLSYLTVTDDTQPYVLTTNRTTVAVRTSVALHYTDPFLRVRFYQHTGFNEYVPV